MDIRGLIIDILGGRSVSEWTDEAADIAYNNWVNNRKSLTFDEVYENILSIAVPSSYLHWVKYHNNEETRRFRNRIKYRYNKFKSIREICLYLHSQNYLASKYGSPTENEVEDLLMKDHLWYKHRNYTEEENSVLSSFLQDELDVENE